MNIYKELGLKTIINASDTYTRIGGSRMTREVLKAMNEASEYFVDIVEMSKKINAEVAGMTHNEAAFISSGAGACMVLTASSLMTKGDPELVRILPDTSKCKQNEIIVFESQTQIPMLPYWHLIELSGAKLVKISSAIEDLNRAITDRTAGVYYFLANFYEKGLPPLKEIIQLCHDKNVRIVIDAAAQLPPKSNLWYYTRDLGADGIIFSGGKFLKGPQSTGLFLGSSEIADHCYCLSNPNVSIGRPYKVGKEEYAGIYQAIKQFVESDENEVKSIQNKNLDKIEEAIADCTELSVKRVHQGRLEQDEPMLIIDLPEGWTGSDCAKFMYEQCDPAIDIGCYKPDDPTGKSNQIFINSINLRDNELLYIADAIKRYISHISKSACGNRIVKRGC